MDKTEMCVDAYRNHKNLKLAAAEISIPWQTVYWHLRKAGEPVAGDKARYGSETDRLAVKAERRFLEIAPHAIDQNRHTFQSKFDFLVHGHRVDVKSSRLLRGGWMFSLKKQEMVADFFVCFGYDELGNDVQTTLLLPGELIRHYSTVRLNGSGKWAQYQVDFDGLRRFMASLSEIEPQEACS